MVYINDCQRFEEDFPGANIILHKTGKLPQVMELQIYAN